MLTRKTTAWLLVAVLLTAGIAWVVYRVVPEDGGQPRPRMLLDINIDTLDSLLVETEATTMVCQKRQGTWWLVRPIEARADDERIHTLLDTLALAPVNDVITPQEQRRHGVSPRDYGLTPPQARVLLRGPVTPPVELRVGSHAAHGQSLYVGFTGSSYVWVTDPSLLKALPSSIGDLRDRALLPCPADRLRRIELRSPGTPLIAAERDLNGAWWLKQPEVRRAAPGAVAALLEYVTGSKILSFVHAANGSTPAAATADPYEPGIAYGCHPDESPLVARFWFTDGSPSFEYHELVFGKPRSESPDQVYVLSTDEQLVVTVDAALARILRVDAETLRDRRVWPFAPETVQRLRLRGDSDSVTLERGTTGAWVITQPIQAMAHQEACAALLESLLTLQDTQVSTSESPAKQDLLVELTTSPPEGVHTALVSRVQSPEGDASTALDWHFPATRETHRTDTRQLPDHFAGTAFFAALRDGEVLRIAPASLTALRQQFGTNGTVHAAVRRDSAWHPADATSTGLDAAALDGIVVRVAELRAESVAALAPATLEDYGLREPLGTLVFELGDPEPATRILLLGSESPSGGRFAWVKGQESVFVLEPATAEALLRPIVIQP